MFQPLTMEHIHAIVELQLNQLEHILQKQGIDLQATPEAIDFIASQGFDPQFGARPVKRYIQKRVLNELSRQLLIQNVKPNSSVVLDAFGDNLVFRPPIKKENGVVV